MDTKITEQKPVYIPKCPTCGSPDIKKIPKRESRHPFASELGEPNYTFKTFVCNNCGYAW